MCYTVYFAKNFLCKYLYIYSKLLYTYFIFLFLNALLLQNFRHKMDFLLYIIDRQIASFQKNLIICAFVPFRYVKSN